MRPRTMIHAERTPYLTSQDWDRVADALVAEDDRTATAARELVAGGFDVEDVAVILLRHLDHASVVRAVLEAAAEDATWRRWAACRGLDGLDRETLRAL